MSLKMNSSTDTSVYFEDTELKSPSNNTVNTEDSFSNSKSTFTDVKGHIVTQQQQKYGSTVSLGQWSSWSSYTNCEKNCSGIMVHGDLLRRGPSSLWSYSKFKGLRVSTRSCKLLTNTKIPQETYSNHKRCIGPTHRYQECPGLKVC